MKENENQLSWWTGISLRICHSELLPDTITQELNRSPSYTQEPGTSKIPHGDCKSAGYWCLSHRVDSPVRPDQVFLWAEQIAQDHEVYFRELLDKDYTINFYIGIHTNILALGFDLPPTPTLWKLNIPIGVEYFSS